MPHTESQTILPTQQLSGSALREKQPSHSDIVTGEWFEIVGRATRDVPEIAKNCDLTVLGGPFEACRRLLPNVMECTLLASERPIPFVLGGSIDNSAKHIVVAWDASAPACRAMMAAVPLLQWAGEICLLSIQDQYEDPAEPQNLVEYLAWHGFDASGGTIQNSRARVGHTLLSAARETDTKFLIMGRYARHRFEEAVLGGMTREGLQRSDLPVLVMH